MVNCYIIAIIFPKIGILTPNNGGNEGDEQLCYGGDNFNISAKKQITFLELSALAFGGSWGIRTPGTVARTSV